MCRCRWRPPLPTTARREGEAAYLLRLDVAAETLMLFYDDGVRLREALAPQARVPGLRSGRTATIGFMINGSDLYAYVDGGLAMLARDLRITRSTLPPDLFIGGEGGVGIVRITSARLYALL